jgi:hypothetical protein
MKPSSLFLFAAVIAVAGCSNKEDQIVGKYKADLKLSAEDEKNPMASFAKGLLGSMTLEIKKDKTYSMTVMSFPIDGNWSLSGDTVTLTAKTVAGMSAEDAAKKAKDSGKLPAGQDPSKPMVLTIGSDGKSLVPAEQKSGQAKFQFVKE